VQRLPLRLLRLLNTKDDDDDDDAGENVGARG
jgi:hypothetical protein